MLLPTLLCEQMSLGTACSS